MNEINESFCYDIEAPHLEAGEKGSGLAVT